MTDVRNVLMSSRIHPWLCQSWLSCNIIPTAHGLLREIHFRMISPTRCRSLFKGISTFEEASRRSDSSEISERI